jgi:hypothetical protein
MWPGTTAAARTNDVDAKARLRAVGSVSARIVRRARLDVFVAFRPSTSHSMRSTRPSKYGRHARAPNRDLVVVAPGRACLSDRLTLPEVDLAPMKSRCGRSG